MYKNKDYRQPLLTFSVILNRYVEHIRVSLPRYTPKVAYATFQDREADIDNASNNAGNNAGNDVSSNRPNTRRRNCLCGSDPDQGNHTFAHCPYVNPTVRPTGWKGQKEVYDRFKKAAEKSPRFASAYERHLDKY